MNHIHAHWLTTSSTLAMVTSRLTGISWSATAHRGDIVANNLLSQKFKSALLGLYQEVVLNWRVNGQKFCDSKVRLLHLGVELSEAETILRSNADELRPVKILCPANLIPVKGHEFLLKSLSVVKHKTKVKLLIAGDGPLRDKLEKLVSDYCLAEMVTFCGHVPHSVIMGWYKSRHVDIVVLPSQDLGGGLHEGIPVSLMEAMAYKIPVVSTMTGGIPELLVKDNNDLYGDLVSPTDHEGLATKLDSLVSSKKEEIT
ncbi:glycosyltransferase [Oceanimonas sp. NS1]|nr:glycosyltransferase [Oceanimonas sp. NS1]